VPCLHNLLVERKLLIRKAAQHHLRREASLHWTNKLPKCCPKFESELCFLGTVHRFHKPPIYWCDAIIACSFYLLVPQYFLNWMFCWPCIIVTWLCNEHNQLDTLHFHYDFIEVQSLDTFQALLAHHRETHTNAALVTIVCSCRCAFASGSAHIYNCTQYSPKLNSCSVSWWWASNARNMSRLWTSIKW
jgi:hypothetical protein